METIINQLKVCEKEFAEHYKTCPLNEKNRWAHKLSAVTKRLSELETAYYYGKR